MADIKTPEQRSKNMSAVKNKDTKPELFLRKQLFKMGYRYRIAPSTVVGHPDIYMAKHNLAIFVHGCFWHRHTGCKHASVPKTREEFWNKKFESNINRDIFVKKSLQEQHIRCLIIWECIIKQAQRNEHIREELLMQTTDFIESERVFLEIPEII